jgi:sodium-type flagellar protein MotY
MRLIKTNIFIALALVCSNAVAGFKVYEAPMDDSKWQFEGSLINCRLSHSIPFYGDAEFEKNAGKNKDLDFKIGYKRQPLTTQKTATVQAIAPSWQPQQASRYLGEVKLASGKYLLKSKNIASWKLLNELEGGRFPTFNYQAFNQHEDQVSVALSSIGFQPEYDKFLDCLGSLITFDLHEVEKMTLYFDFDRDSVRAVNKPKLDALAAYIRFDPSIEVVFIEGYTDSKGSRSYNQKLAERRIASVKKQLSLEGVDQNRFKTIAYGEKNPAARNRTASGRAKNRRVYIKIAQK